MPTIIAHGHPNVQATHKTTLEVTTSKELTLKGDCIIAVNAEFDKKEIVAFLSAVRRMEVTIEIGNDALTFSCEPNPHFDSDKELVFRRSEFPSERTIGLRATMACIDLPRDFVRKLKNPEQKVLIHLEATTE